MFVYNRKPSTSSESEDFLLVQAPQDRRVTGGVNVPPSAPGVMPLPGSQSFSGHTGRGAGVVSSASSSVVGACDCHGGWLLSLRFRVPVVLVNSCQCIVFL